MVSLGALPVLGLAEVSVSRSVPLIRGLLAALGYYSLLNTLKGEKGNIGAQLLLIGWGFSMES